MQSSGDRMARLRAEIERLEAEATDLEAELLDLRATLAEFSQRFDRLIRPFQDRLEAIKGAIADLEAQRRPSGEKLSSETGNYTDWLGEGYISVEEQYRRKWQRSENDASSPGLSSDWRPDEGYVPVEEQFRRTWQRSTNDETPPLDPEWWREQPENAPRENLRQLYRKLVRQYHPDLTTDPVERQRRNRLMAEINEAYSERNETALRALAAYPTGTGVLASLAALEVRQLQQVHDQLERRVSRLKRERNDLFNSDLMWSKIQETLVAREGRDYLREQVALLDAEYAALLKRFDALRGL